MLFQVLCSLFRCSIVLWFGCSALWCSFQEFSIVFVLLFSIWPGVDPHRHTVYTYTCVYVYSSALARICIWNFYMIASLLKNKALLIAFFVCQIFTLSFLWSLPYEKMNFFAKFLWQTKAPKFSLESSSSSSSLRGENFAYLQIFSLSRAREKC